jgi:hypothetical protein
MFTKMSKALLIICLTNRTSIYSKPELYPLFWLFVLFYIIGKSVIQFTNFYIRIRRNRFAGIGDLSRKASQKKYP